MKTVDNKNVFKVTDLSQIVVCSHELNPYPAPSTSSTNVANPESKSAKKEARQWQYPHGLTPPMKSARRRRFRKTKKKKYMDAPEVCKNIFNSY